MNWPPAHLWFTIGIPALYIALLITGKLLKRRGRVRLGPSYHLFAVAFAVWLPLRLHHWDFEWGWFRLSRELGAATFLLGVMVFLALLRRWLWEGFGDGKRGVPIPKFLSQVVAIVVMAIAVLVVAGVVYGQQVSALLFGSSGILALVLGFAMQDLLGNIIAGLSVHAGKVYRIGDWLLVEGQYAEVMEINWRSTRLRNNDGIFLDVPNSQIVRRTVVNLNLHTRHYAMRLRIGVDYRVPPNEVKRVLLYAAEHAKGVLREPAPRVFLVDFGESAVLYEIKFCMDNHALYNQICDAIRTSVWYALHREGIKIPYPIRTIEVARRNAPSGHALGDRVLAMVRAQAMFRALTAEETDLLLDASRLLEFGRDEVIIERGAEGASMFVVARGEVTVHLDRDGVEPAIARLKEGDCFGEMSLLTGEPRNATVKAGSDCELLEIRKGGMARLLSQNPGLSAQLSDLLAKRRAEIETRIAERSGIAGDGAAGGAKDDARTLLAKITRFFEL